MNILVKDGEIVGFTELNTIEGYEVISAPAEWDGNIEKLKYENGKIVLLSEEEYLNLRKQKITSQKIKELNEITDIYFYQEAEQRGGYKNMGEILYDAQNGDPDALFLKSLYDAVWAKEEEYEAQLKQKSLEELLELDLESWAKDTYDQVKSNLMANQTNTNQQG